MAQRGKTIRMHQSKEALIAAVEKLNDDVYPIFKKNGDFICFIRRDSFIMFYALFKKLPGHYIESESEHPNETTAWRIEGMLSGHVDDHIQSVDQDVLVDKMLAVRDQLSTPEHIAFVKKMCQKYPKSLFKDRWPE